MIPDQMKAMIVDAPGGLDRLRLVERSTPEPGVGEVLVRVRANALNYHDYVVAAGVVAVADHRVVMSDAAGEIAAVGRGVTAFRPGDSVMSVFYPGWLAGEGAYATTGGLIPGETHDGYASEYVAVPATWITRAPAGYSPVEAASLTCAGLTAWRAVVTEAVVRPGDIVLTQGTGGVSIFALQFAKAAGATVIATSSSDKKLEKLREIGADHVINYRQTPEWGRRAKDITGGRGVDHVVDIGGGGTMAQSVAACRMNGRISLIGALAGRGQDAPWVQTFLEQLTIKGIRVGSRADQEAMIRGIEATGVRPVIDSVFPLEQLADAYRRQEARLHFGKICVEL